MINRDNTSSSDKDLRGRKISPPVANFLKGHLNDWNFFLNVFLSRVTVHNVYEGAFRPKPFKNFLELFIRSNSSIQKILQPFDFIRSKSFCSRSRYPFWKACTPVSHPFACRAFSRSNRYRKERFHVRDHMIPQSVSELWGRVIQTLLRTW